ncbi:MAG: serine--tRNA ligase, partial [Carnobacterium sp.]
MLDIKKLRSDFATVEAKLATRGVKKELLENFVELDEKRRELIVKAEKLKKYRNTVSGDIALLKR